MKSATRKSMMSSKYDDYTTPTRVISLLKKFGKIALDPCWNPHSKVPARTKFIRSRGSVLGSLAVEWSPYCVGGFIFVNPPYGRVLSEWSIKIVNEACNGCEIITCVPSRTDTIWYDRLETNANAVVFVLGRFIFEGRPATGEPAFFPSVLHYFGEHAARFCEVFGVLGRAYVIDRSARPLSQLRKLSQPNDAEPR